MKSYYWKPYLYPVLVVFIITLIFSVLIFYNQIFYNQTVSSEIVPEQKPNLINTTAKIGEDSYELYIVNSSEDMQKGLARFDRIEKNQGMLFIFDEPGRYTFFMKDMKFDIDIIFLDEMGKVINIFQNVKKESYRGPFDYEAYKPYEPAKFVVELVAGEVNQNKLKVGDRINFSIPSEMLK